jgi:hypothetical protein
VTDYPRAITVNVPAPSFELNAQVAKDVMRAAPDGSSPYGWGGEGAHPQDGALHELYFQVLGAALRVRALINDVDSAGRLVRDAAAAAVAEARATPMDEGQRLAGLVRQYRELSRASYLQVHWRAGGRVSLNQRWHGATLVEALESAVAELARRASHNPPAGD